MKKFFNRALSVVLAVMMCVGMLSLNVFAAGGHTHTFRYDDAYDANGVCMRKCTKCGQNIACEHSDIYCQWHGGYQEIIHTGGDGFCDYCHAKVDNPHCPGEGSGSCNHINQGRRDDVTLEPTCTMPGKKDIYCTNCNERVAKDEEIPALCHDYTNSPWTDDDANSGREGTHSHSCVRSGCDDYAGSKVSEAHHYNNGVVGADGVTTYTCTDCGHVYTEGCNHTNPDGTDAHVFDRQVTMGNCTTEGTAVYRCTCGHEETRSTGVVADAHDYAHGTTGATSQGASGHTWPCTRDANHPHTTVEVHTFGTWQFSEWKDVIDDDGVVRYQRRTATHICTACGYSETVSFTDSDRKDLTDGDLQQEKGKHSVTVNYVGEDGTVLAAVKTLSLNPGETYNESPVSIAGWTVSNGAALTGTMGEDDVAHTFTYTRNTHTLRIVVRVDGATQSDNSTATAFGAGISYPSQRFGYSMSVTGYQATMPDADLTIYVDYTSTAVPTTPAPSPTPSNEVVVDDPDVPLTDAPELPEEPQESEAVIDDPEVPLNSEPETVIDDPEVPQSDVPQTGDISPLWYCAAALSAGGLTVVRTGKKRKSEDD